MLSINGLHTEYDPSDGMDTVEELKRYIRFLYASLQDKDKENSQMRKDFGRSSLSRLLQDGRKNLVRLAFAPAPN